MNENEHHDHTPAGHKVPLLQGYRKFLVALLWNLLAIFTVVRVLLWPATSGQITVAIWVVGSAGFFDSMFIVGNAVEWTKFFQHKSSSTLEQKDEFKVVYQDSSEDAAWKEAEKE